MYGLLLDLRVSLLDHCVFLLPCAVIALAIFAAHLLAYGIDTRRCRIGKRQVLVVAAVPLYLTRRIL